MNEPSVFDDPTAQGQAGMPLNNTHFREDGTMVRHRDVHNAYGALQHRAGVAAAVLQGEGGRSREAIGAATLEQAPYVRRVPPSNVNPRLYPPP